MHLRRYTINIFVVTAYRWGSKESHSYVVGIFDTLEPAIARAIYEEEWRGGKYECEVISIELNNSSKHQGYEVVHKIEGVFNDRSNH